MGETTTTTAPLSARRRRPRALLSLFFAWATVASADERQAAESSSLRRPVSFKHDDAEVPGPDGELPTNRRNLAIMELFQPPSTTGAGVHVDASDMKGPADNNDNGDDRDVFGQDRTSNVGDAEIGPAYAGYLGGPSPYIVNGQNVPPNRFPFFAAAMNSGSTFAGCSGVLIASDWILTAGHCRTNGFNGSEPPNIAYWRVGYMGAACLKQQNNCGQAYANVQHVETRVHPEYNWRTNSIFPDLALVRLATPVTSNEPVEIDTGTYIPYGGDQSNLQGLTFTVIGAGWTVARDRNSFPQYLQQVDVPFVSRAQCAAAYRDSPNSAHWSTELCAGVQNFDSCNGDSGGPLVIKEGNGKYRLLATVSYGTPDCDGTPPGVYTTVGNQISWIRSVVCDGYHDPSFCLNPPSPRPPTPKPPTPTPPADETRTIITPEVKMLCDLERLTLYRRKGRRNGLPAVKESCIELSGRTKRNRSKICKKKKAAKRKCPQTCNGQCTAYFRTVD